MTQERVKELHKLAQEAYNELTTMVAKDEIQEVYQGLTIAHSQALETQLKELYAYKAKLQADITEVEGNIDNVKGIQSGLSLKN